MQLAEVTDELVIPETFNDLLNMAGYVEDELDALLFAAGEGKGNNPRVDYLVRSLQRDLPHYYVLRQCLDDEDKRCEDYDDQKDYDKANEVFKNAKDDLYAWMDMLDNRVDEVMRLVRVYQLQLEKEPALD